MIIDTIDDIKKSYIIRKINQERLNAILKFAGYSILDVGCGNGEYVLNLANKYDIHGVDINSYESWSSMPNSFSISNAEKLNWEDNSIDTIVSFETLEHLQKPELALKEYYRVCRKNLIVTVPNCSISPGMSKSKFIYNHWIDRTHIQFFTLDEIKQIITDSGFEIITSYYINKINLLPLFYEAFKINSFFDKLLFRYLKAKENYEYHLSCMIIANKS